MFSDVLAQLDPTLLAALFGSLVGLVLGLTGAGGGILAVPLLVFGLNMPLNMAAPVGLIAVGMAAAVGTIQGLHEGIVRYRAAALIGTFGMISAPLGVWLGQRVPNAPLLVAFSFVLLYTAWRMYQQSMQGHQDGEACQGQPCKIDPHVGRLLWTMPCARALAATGMLSGLFSGLFGVGGGFVIVPSLSRNTDLVPRSVLATSLAVIMLVAIGGITAAALQGTISWPVALPFAAGAIAGQVLGRLASARVAGSRLQQSFALVCLIVAVMLFARGLGWTSL